MKRLYSLLPKKVVQRVRNVLEFDGGVTDTHVYRAGTDADLSSGLDYVYRPHPGSKPPARIPQGPPERAYDIKYYTRDVRKAPLPSDIAIDASFHPEAAKLLDRPALIEAPKPGSPGMKNPDVERYDPSGMRAAMTTNHPSVTKELARHRGTHVSRPTWERTPGASAAWFAEKKAAGVPVESLVGIPTQRRVMPWGYTHTNEW